MNKTMEYMAYGLPAVSFDLTETRVSGGDCVLYVPTGDIAAFADAVERLIDDPQLRADLGSRARERVARELDWRPQAEAYVAVYDELTGYSQPGPAVPVVAVRPERDQLGRRYVDDTDAAGFRRHLIERGRVHDDRHEPA